MDPTQPWPQDYERTNRPPLVDSRGAEELESAERWRYHCEATSSGYQLQVLTTGFNYRFQLHVSATATHSTQQR